ncbi:MAG: cysteine--tRNA ligase [Candidatus Rokubacteria bacterium 13_1_40CM_69_27]|nr:MAG: cysteine--tRNA ligase [Candidatus Rokubacteria bacterium 13_1_40CM_69_27]
MKIYSTLTRTKEELVPLAPKEVRMYVCGVTVYGVSHVGHARSAIVFDVIRRYLAFKGYRVTFVKNFTDVDDKIIKRAQEEGVSPSELSERYIAEFYQDMEAIGVLRADIEPKATDHIPEMIVLIERLLAGGFAYVVDGDVYFEIRQFPGYGRLSGKNLDELLAGARVEVDERKRDPRDFALWKSAKPGEPSWPSPWGDGRPGWHIECSAMSMRYLGESFDIHGGGEDLMFPHHECEIAQSEAATGQPFARYWIHNGFVNLGAEKMSKSLGNILTIRELVKRHDPDALRLWLLGTHYRNPVEFAEERVRETARALERLRGLIIEAERLSVPGIDGRYPNALERGYPEAWLAAIGHGELTRRAHPCVERFTDAMDDDFNTPGALAALFDLSHELYRYREAVGQGGKRADAFANGVRLLARLGWALGLFQRPAEGVAPSPARAAQAEPLVAEREQARNQRDWKRADELREALRKLGATVEDTPTGPRLKWERT